MRSGGREGARERWNVPDWRDEAAYPKPDELSDKVWRWEFIRRMRDYRIAWDRAAPIQYELSCQQTEKSGRDKRLIRKPDDIYFTVNSAAYSFPDRFTDLIKYKVHPLHNPRLSPPRFFEHGPSMLRFRDEDGGVRARVLAPKPNTRREPVIIPAGWTMIGIDLTEPIPAQLARARVLLEQLQMNHAEEWNFGDRLKAKKSARRHKTLPDYALSSAIRLWYKTGTYGFFCGFERWRATRCNFKRGSARPSLLFFTEQRISAGRR